VAETLVGEILEREGARQRVHIFSRVASLVPFDLPSPHVSAGAAYPGRHIRAQTEAMLARLGVDRLACQQIHAWCPEWLGEGDWLETLVRLREEGKIAAIGVSLFDHDADAGLQAVAGGEFDCIQLMYNIFDPGAAETVLPLCRKHGVGAIVRSPLHFGALSAAIGKAAPFPAGDWRADYFFEEHLGETRQRVLVLQPEADRAGGSVTDLALRFSLSHPSVSTVAVGMRTRAHVEANLDAVDRGPLASETLERLSRHKWLC
jgi:aryl-alcohol dehydrogenase-like predicted oxidoreductase